MNEQEKIDFKRIAEAIEYIRCNFKSQPRLDDVAGSANLSAFHFQRLFTDWAGTSPKKFLQYISIGYAKKLLKENKVSLFETGLQTGLSGGGRLHDLFVTIEGMTPGEYKNGGENLAINFSFSQTIFGQALVASTASGICHIAFAEDDETALTYLKSKFPNASFRNTADEMQQHALRIFNPNRQDLNQVKLHLKGTDFQLKIWEALLKIPRGRLATYSEISKHIHNPGASRAVGTAIGANPVAFLIPCHRVIQSTGIFGGYRWGETRKTAMIGWEAASISNEKQLAAYAELPF